VSLRVLVVDDEPLARARLVRLLARIEGALVCGEAGDGHEALAKMAELDPDVLLLDIGMPGLDGLAVAEARREGGPAVIFTTAHPQFAIDAFEAEATDYLLKPVIVERLARALERVARTRGQGRPKPTKPEPSPTRLTVQDGNTLRIFDVESIRRFRATEKYVVFRADGEEHETRESLSALEARLTPLGFVRVHRSELVRLSRVQRFEPEPGGGAVLVLDDGQRAPVSRRSSADIRRLLSSTKPET